MGKLPDFWSNLNPAASSGAERGKLSPNRENNVTFAVAVLVARFWVCRGKSVTGDVNVLVVVRCCFFVITSDNGQSKVIVYCKFTLHAVY